MGRLWARGTGHGAGRYSHDGVIASRLFPGDRKLLPDDVARSARSALRALTPKSPGEPLRATPGYAHQTGSWPVGSAGQTQVAGNDGRWWSETTKSSERA